jgi:type II secretory pathway pseudopilin PulG
MKRFRAFTLIELMVASALLMVLVGGVTVVMGRQRDVARIESFRRDRALILQASDLYFRLYGQPPGKMEDLTRSKILLGENRSPWNTPYSIVFDEKSGIKVTTRDAAGRTFGAEQG